MKYRIVYYFGSIATDFIVNANSGEEAIKKFEARKGNKQIIRIDCIE